MENKKYYLVKQDVNYADEFDVQGFWVQESESQEEIENNLIKTLKSERGEFPMEMYFGTNEAIEFETEEDYLMSLDIKEITEDEYKVITKLFGDSFGDCF